MIGIGGTLGYWEYRGRELKKQTENEELIDVRKDTTRPSNVYYGINWGYRSDETIEKSLDTGDLLLFDYDCDKCFTAKETLECHY